MDTDNNCLLVIHQGVVTVMQPVLPPTVVIEDFDWQSKYLIATLRHSVLYLEKIGEAGDDASISSTVGVLLSCSKPTNIWTYMICHVPSIALGTPHCLGCT